MNEKSWTSTSTASSRLKSLTRHIDVVKLDSIANGDITEADLLVAARSLGYPVSRRAGSLWVYLKAPVHDASWAVRMKRQT